MIKIMASKLPIIYIPDVKSFPRKEFKLVYEIKNITYRVNYR